jgi:hypothetical protein
MNLNFVIRALGHFVICLVILGTQMLLVSAQPATQTKGKPKAEQQSSSPARKSSDADQSQGARRNTAILLLVDLANQARSFSDLALRARAQARVADVLWRSDEPRARQLFMRAWDEVDSLERAQKAKAEATKSDNDKGQAEVSGANLRIEILRLAALRDRKLAEELLDKLNGDKPKESASDSAVSPLDLTQAEIERMEVAQQLLSQGHTQNAQDLAGPMLNRVTEQTVRFLSTLRVRFPTEADNQFALLLARAGRDPSSDGITVSFLSSYIFSPLVFVSVTRDGFTNSSQYGRPLAPPNLSPDLRAAFFQTASDILLRPLPDIERTSAGRPGTYFTILRLLPLFERFAPKFVPSLRTQLTVVSEPIYADVFNPNTNHHLTEGLTNAKQTTKELPIQVDLNNAKTAQERDTAYLNSAQNTAVKGDEAARDYADKIDDPALRKQVRAYIDFLLLTEAIESRDAEKVITLARSDYLTRFQRAWGLSEAAGLLIRSEPTRASEVLNESWTEARRIDEGSIDRVRGLIAVASELFDLDPSRTWEVVNEVVKAVNNSKGYSGEDSRISVRFRVGETIAEKNFKASTLNLGSLFQRLAKRDMYAAINSAQSLTVEAPRVIALISIARTVLDEPSQPSARR